VYERDEQPHPAHLVGYRFRIARASSSCHRAGSARADSTEAGGIRCGVVWNRVSSVEFRVWEADSGAGRPEMAPGVVLGFGFGVLA